MGRWTRGPTVGRGSSATVSVAVDGDTGEVLAVKSAELSQSESLQREQLFLSCLSSAHIVGFKGFDVSEEDGKLLYNLFLDFFPRGTLRDEIERHGGKLTEPVIAEYTRQVVAGLEYLHSRGVAHCDLKPRNILIGDGGGAKISDFGCAKRVYSGTGRRQEKVGGTPMFLAPEVARGEEQGCSGDVWALGCTVIEMATGKAPWPDAGDHVSVLYRIAYSGETPAIPSSLSEQAKDFVEKCLRRNPKERWTAAELLTHPFLVQATTSDGTNQAKGSSDSCSPTCVLDDHEIWNSLEETEHVSRPVDTSLGRSASDRMAQLSSSSGRPDWTWEEDWITLRMNYDEMQDENRVSRPVLEDSFSCVGHIISLSSNVCNTYRDTWREQSYQYGETTAVTSDPIVPTNIKLIQSISSVR